MGLISYLVYSNISKTDSHIYSSLGVKGNNKFGILKAVGGKLSPFRRLGAQFPVAAPFRALLLALRLRTVTPPRSLPLLFHSALLLKLLRFAIVPVVPQCW